MPDGPFKYSTLSHRWKRFGVAACNDAYDSSERCALAKDAILHEILNDENLALVRDLEACARRPQLELDPKFAVHGLFSGRPMTPFGDILQREAAIRIEEKNSIDAAYAAALHASVREHTGLAYRRFQEELILARERGELTQKQYGRALAHVTAAFDMLNVSEICDAIRARDRSRFKGAVSKKTGIDDGPNL